uniref:Protein Wnt n=1 Tax=Culicoides sonorensis TaxID=179676 RepID=A0A336LLE8_CULSO
MKVSFQFYRIFILVIVFSGNECLKAILNPNSVCHNAKKNTKGTLGVICSNEPLYSEIKRGIELGLNECKKLFKYRRWNCTNQKKSLKRTLMRDTKETGFLYAITSAGVTYSITKACSMGTLIDCSCDKSHKKHYVIQSKFKVNTHKMITNNNVNNYSFDENTNYSKTYQHSDQHFNFSNNRSIIAKEIMYKNYMSRKNFKALADGQWEWSGCDDNVNHGLLKSKEFFDTKMRKRSDLKSNITIHNSEVGRLMVKSHMRLECKCHGLSGSCVTKTCWMKLLPFYEVIASSDRKGYKPVNQRINEKVIKKRIIYLEKSPNFCYSDYSLGSLGTSGRICFKDDCKDLCCDRGFIREFIKIETSCNCSFKWCCEVKCDKCVKEKQILKCN